MEIGNVGGACWRPCPTGEFNYIFMKYFSIFDFHFTSRGASRRPLHVLLFFIACPLFASQSQLKEGNRQFKNKNYDKALQLYEDALIDTPYSSILHFNAGDAAAMMGDDPKAEPA